MADEDFGAADAGASETVPVRAGEVKKGHYVVIKGKPCKVVDYSTSKTGKHGHAKAKIVALDVFTNRKYEDICPTSHNMTAPIVKRQEYQLVDVGEEGYATLMNEDGETLDTLRLPPEERKDLDEDMKVYAEMIEEFQKGEKDVYVIVMSAMSHEQILPQYAARG